MTLYSVLAAKCYWHFSIKTLDKTNKKMQTKLLFVSLSLSFSRNVNSEYIAGAGGCGIKPKKKLRTDLYITDQI